MRPCGRSSTWGSATGSATTIPALIIEQTRGASRQKFGMWCGTDANNIQDMVVKVGSINKVPEPGSLFFAAAGLRRAGSAVGRQAAAPHRWCLWRQVQRNFSKLLTRLQPLQGVVDAVERVFAVDHGPDATLLHERQQCAKLREIAVG